MSEQLTETVAPTPTGEGALLEVETLDGTKGVIGDGPAVITPIPGSTAGTITKRPNATNVKQEAEVFAPLDKPSDANGIALSLSSASEEEINAALDGLPNVDIGETASGEEWIARIRNSGLSRLYKGYLNGTVERPEAAFRQTVPSEKGNLAAGGVTFNDSINGKLTGERAVLRVRSLLGLGSVAMIPLWHSGFWITLKAPTEAAMLELNRRLTEEKIQLGRASYGLAYANNSVFFAGWLIDFAISHVYDTSLKADIAEDIRSKISQLDVPIIIWGLACSIWPTGFPYARAVLDQNNEPNKVIKEKINIGKILWVDTASLTPWQISHMAQKHGNNMTQDSLERYRNEFVRGKGRVVKLTDNLSITLRVPNINQYLVSGQKWVNNIVAMVDRAFAMHPNDGIRDTYITDQGRATNMRQYAHFIESLEVAGDKIDDVDTLEQTVDMLSSDDKIREIYFASMKTFIEDSTMAVVAIPVTENAEVSDLPRFPHLLPIDVMSVFFILLVQKSLQIQSRD